MGYERVRGPKQLLVTGAASFAETQTLFAQADFHRAELLPWYDHHLKGIDNGGHGPAERALLRAGRGRGARRSGLAPARRHALDLLSQRRRRADTSDPLNDGSLVEDPPGAGGGETILELSRSQVDGGRDHLRQAGRSRSLRTGPHLHDAPFERDREFTGQGVLALHASSDQTDMDVMVKLSLLPLGDDKPAFMKVSQGWLRASHRAEDPDLTTDMRPFLKHDQIEPIDRAKSTNFASNCCRCRFWSAKGERMRLEISNWESAITEAPMTHWYGQKVGTDTYHHSSSHPSHIRLHERPRHATGRTEETTS